MGTFDNIKTKILKTPTARDITPRELQSFLDHYGFTLKRSKGSHFMYEYPGEVRNIMLNTLIFVDNDSVKDILGP